MDARITKKRLSQMLSYDWIKILACILGGIFLWSLIFTTTATRLNPAQKFTVYAYVDTIPESDFSSKASSRSALCKRFSYDVLETSVVDLTKAGDQSYTLLEARLGVQEGNVAFVSPLGFEIESGDGEKVKRTYVQDLLMRTYPSVLSCGEVCYTESGESLEITPFFERTETFLNLYYTEGYQNPESFSAEKVEESFRNRIRSQKDKRYKNEEQIRRGIEDEMDRIKGYRDNYVAVRGYLDDGIIKLEEETIPLFYTDKAIEIKGLYSINLCPDDRMSDLKNLISYQDETVGKTAKNMRLVLLDLLKEEYSYGLYESYAFIRSLVETYQKA